MQIGSSKLTSVVGVSTVSEDTRIRKTLQHAGNGTSSRVPEEAQRV